jgi:hypothetical protein
MESAGPAGGIQSIPIEQPRRLVAARPEIINLNWQRHMRNTGRRRIKNVF